MTLCKGDKALVTTGPLFGQIVDVLDSPNQDNKRRVRDEDGDTHLLPETCLDKVAV